MRAAVGGVDSIDRHGSNTYVQNRPHHTQTQTPTHLLQPRRRVAAAAVGRLLDQGDRPGVELEEEEVLPLGQLLGHERLELLVLVVCLYWGVGLGLVSIGGTRWYF